MSMRLGLVALIWLCILGGAIGFMHVEAPTAMVPVPEVRRVAGDYSLEVTATFPLEPDPFALTVDGAPAGVLTVSYDGETIFAPERLQPHEPRRISPLPDMMAGVNEFLVSAAPPVGAESHAVRLRLFRGDVPLAEETFWAAQGAHITGALRVDANELRDEHAQ